MNVKGILKKYWFWMLLSFGLSLLVSRFTFHTDIFSVANSTIPILNGNFSMLRVSSDGVLKYASFFPPLCHYIDALFLLPFYKLGLGRFDLNNVVIDQFLFVGFLFKLRYIFALFLSFFLMICVAKEYEIDLNKKRKIIFLWLLCSSAIYLVSSWGNIDIYPTLLLLFFLLFAFKKNNILAMVFLGLSAATKNFSLFLVLPAALILSNKNWKKTLIYVLCAGLVYLIPWFLYRNVISISAFTSGGEGLFILGKTILGGPLFFPLVYFLTILFLIIEQKINDLNKNDILIKYCFLVISFFYLTSFYMPNWFLWITPFFALTAYKNRKMFYLYLLISITFFVSILGWSKNLDIMLFSTSFPIINYIHSPYEFMLIHLSSFKILDMVYTLFFSAFILYIYILFFNKATKDNLTEKEIKWFSLLPLFIYLLICFIYVFGMVFVRNKKNRDWYDLGLVSRNEFIGPIVNANMFYQTFESPKDRLKGINVYFSTYGKKINSAYELVLYESDCKTEIKKVNIDVVKIEDNKYKEVVFDEIVDSAGKNYCFTIVPKDSNVDTPVTLNYSQKDFYSDGELSLNGKKTKDDVVFQLIYPIK